MGKHGLQQRDRGELNITENISIFYFQITIFGLIMKYNAFISYSHATDSDLAPKLERALEQFAKPAFKRRALKFFRDSNDLSASPDLWGKIEEGLHQSDYFIFFASPKAAQSRWCKKEVEYWKANKPINNFLIALTDGELVWDETAGDFDWEKTTAIPQNLSGAFKNEPLFVDFRNYTGEEDLTLNNPDFKKKTVLIAATLHQKAVGDMVGEGLMQHKRTIRIRNSAIAILSVLLLAAVGMSIFALIQRQKATDNEKEALKQKSAAEMETLRQVAANYLARAGTLAYTDKTQSLSVAYQGYRFADSLDLDKTDLTQLLLEILHDPNPLYIQQPVPSPALQKPQPLTVKRTVNGNIITLEEGNNYEIILITNLGTVKRVRYENISGFDLLTFSPKGNFIIVQDTMLSDMGGILSHYLAFDLDGKMIGESYGQSGADEVGGKYDAVVLFDEAETMLISLNQSVYNRRSLMIYNESKISTLSNNNEEVTAAALDSKGKYVAYGTESGTIRVINVEGGVGYISREWKVVAHNAQPIRSFSFSNDDKYLVSTSDQSTHYWPVEAYNRAAIIFDQDEFETPASSRFKEATITQFGNQWDSTKPFRYEFLPTWTNQPIRFDSIIDFINAEDPVTKRRYGNSFNLRSPDSNFVFRKNGIYTAKGKLVVPITVDFSPDQHRIFTLVAFSPDSKYMLFWDTQMAPKAEKGLRVYILDPEIIINRIKRKPEIFGLLNW